MKKTIVETFCDRCKKPEVMENHDYGVRCLAFAIGDNAGGSNVKMPDLCLECSDLLVDWINND